MSQTFRRNDETSPFAARRDAMHAPKRERFEARRMARLVSHKAQALAELDALPPRD